MKDNRAQIAALSILLAVLALTFIFCMLRQLIQAIGRERFMEMFFGRGPQAGRRAA